jgi:hypothetical protein
MPPSGSAVLRQFQPSEQFAALCPCEIAYAVHASIAATAVKVFGLVA